MVRVEQANLEPWDALSFFGIRVGVQTIDVTNDHVFAQLLCSASLDFLFELHPKRIVVADAHGWRSFHSLGSKEEAFVPAVRFGGQKDQASGDEVGLEVA